MVIKGYDHYKAFLGKDRKPGFTRKEEANPCKNFIDVDVAKNLEMVNGTVTTVHLSSRMAFRREYLHKKKISGAFYHSE